MGIGLAVPSFYGLATGLTIHNTGYMGVVGLFSDVNCTQPIVGGTLNWSTIFPATTANQTVYVKNFGGQNVNLTMTVSNWNPLNTSQYVSVTWDHEKSILLPGVAEQTTIYLTTYANETSSGIGGFSFDLTINPAW